MVGWKLRNQYDDETLAELLTSLYWNKKLSSSEIGRKLDVGHHAIIDQMKRLNIPRRSLSEALKVRRIHEEMGFAKGHVPWNKGKSMSKQLRRKISRLVKDLWEDKDYRKRMSEAHVGKKLPKEQKQKIGEATKRLWTKEEYRNKTLKALRKALNIRPNHQEQKLIELIKENTLPYKYVGDGAVIINGFCPDFINCNGAKKIIEVFGDYWHNRPNMAYYHTEEGRKAVFREYGFDTLVIWEHELSEPDRVLQRILEFDGSITGREI